MKSTKKLLGFFLSLAVIVGLFIASPVTAEANYTYRVKLSLGNNSNASFNEEYLTKLKDSYKVDYVSGDTRTIVFTELTSADSIKLDAKKLVDITATEEDTTYYVKGLKFAGENDLVDNDADIDQPIDGDATFVVAYGVGTTYPYTVKYVDEKGNALIEDEILYGAEGEVVKVPARHIAGYKPDAFFKKNSSGLKAGVLKTDASGKNYVENGTEFTFVYKKTTSSISYVTEYEYEYQYAEESSSSTNQNPTVIHRRNERNTQPAPAAGNAGGNAADANAADNDADANNDQQTIEDEETPLDIVDIDDEGPATHGGEKERFTRNMILAIVFAIVAVVIALIAIYTAEKKRRAEAVRTNDTTKKDE